jgi:hypothetical protein
MQYCVIAEDIKVCYNHVVSDVMIRYNLKCCFVIRYGKYTYAGTMHCRIKLCIRFGSQYYRYPRKFKVYRVSQEEKSIF